MNCLVTGGAGFIGSHLVDVLVAEGNNVVVIDSLISGKKSNLVDVWDKIEFVQVDITRDDISDFFVGCDVVFHLAALADIVPSIVDPVGYVKIFDYVAAGNYAAAKAEQERLFAMFGLVDVGAPGRMGRGSSAIGAFKAALKLLGIIEDGRTAPPAIPLNAEESAAIIPFLKNAGLSVK